MEGQFGKQMCPCCPSGGPEMGRAVMLRELAKDEEVTLPGSQLCQNLWDPFLFTTLNLISSTIAPFISLSFSSFHVLLSLIVSGALVPGSLSLFLLAFFSWFLKKFFFLISSCPFSSNLSSIFISFLSVLLPFISVFISFI